MQNRRTERRRRRSSGHERAILDDQTVTRFTDGVARLQSALLGSGRVAHGLFPF